MDPRIKKLWVEKLRSGEYTQHRGSLVNRTGTSFCCLGVLCDLHSKETNTPWRDEFVADDVGFPRSYLGKLETLPLDVVGWANIQSQDASRVYNPRVQVEGHTELRTLAFCNDGLKMSFNQIADLVEEQL